MTCIHDVPLDETCRDCILGRDCMLGESAEAGAPVETLRDRFAMAALTGMLAEGPGVDAVYARECYALADAMLAERGKR